MSLLDSLMGQGGANQGSAGLMEVVGNLINQAGGISGLVSHLQQAGLGSQVQSWVSTGTNQPVSASALGAALQSGPLAGAVQEAAQKLGTDPAQLMQKLSGVLPQVVDHLTPDGQVPAQPSGGFDLGSLAGLAGKLFG